MERVSRFLEGATGARSGKAITDAVVGKRGGITAALQVLVVECYVDVTPGPRGSFLHTSTRSYRQADDPRSNTYRGEEQEEQVSPVDDVPEPPEPGS